jgi:DNA-binding NtrC family response regulator
LIRFVAFQNKILTAKGGIIMTVSILDTTRVLIVESVSDLAQLWKSHLVRQGMSVTCARGQADAIDHISQHDTDIIILDLVIEEGSALAIADYTNYRQPAARVIFVTNTSFFSDGSIFAHSANARAFVQSSTPPEDLAAMVAYYGAERHAN